MKVFDHTLPPDLCFPKPPFRIDRHGGEVPVHAITSYLDGICSWRAQVLEFLSSACGKPLPENHYLSPRAREELATFLSTSWAPAMAAYAAQSPYNLCAFPQDVLERDGHSGIESVLAVLRWRAGVVDYWCDASDVINPALDFEEYIMMDRFLTPLERKNLCCFCLTEFAPEQRHPGSHECVLAGHVCAKWPQPPSAFRKWAAEAKKNSP